MATEIRVPTLGESITEATVGKWFKKAGESVRSDEPLVELETDKVTLEINAPSAGVLSEIAAETGQTVAIVEFGGGYTTILPPESPWPTESFESPSSVSEMPRGTNAPKLWPAEPWSVNRMVSSDSPSAP